MPIRIGDFLEKDHKFNKNTLHNTLHHVKKIAKDPSELMQNPKETLKHFVYTPEKKIEKALDRLKRETFEVPGDMFNVTAFNDVVIRDLDITLVIEGSAVAQTMRSGVKTIPFRWNVKRSSVDGSDMTLLRVLSINLSLSIDDFIQDQK